MRASVLAYRLAAAAALVFVVWRAALARVPPAAPSPFPPRQRSDQGVRQAAPLTLWHLTDTHLNLWHSHTGDVREMCRVNTSERSRHPSAFGHFNCDPSPGLLELALERMRAAAPQPTLILWGGDVYGHVPPAREGAAAVARSQRVQAALIAKAFPGTTVLPALGNHDTWPYFVSGGDGATEAKASLAALYLSSQGKGGAPAAIDLRARGYYAYRLPLHAVWVVALETNMLSIADAAGEARAQLQWLRSVLDAARREGVEVLLLGHIAPGASHIDWDSMAASGWAGGGWTADSQQAFYHLLHNFSSVVSAGFFGHLHTESVRLLGARYKGQRGAARRVNGAQPRSGSPSTASGDASLPVMYLSPSLTPRNPTPHQPAVRHFTLTGHRTHGASTDAPRAPSLAVTRVNDLVFDLEQSNLKRTAVWHMRDVQHELQLTSFSASAWARWAESLLDDALFIRYMSAQRCADEVDADYGKCKASLFCAMVELEPRPYSRCLKHIRANAIPPALWREAAKRMP
ncbi:hypothetical protein AB1Y20_007027 [Prymnesium parvum]|uniref:Calcineurin-like phosphoesterase domain-containing protein n=1 Tax=Prymnesium parvum TaxID=97485 RepID=A0AB34J2G9_PRYPA